MFLDWRGGPWTRTDQISIIRIFCGSWIIFPVPYHYYSILFFITFVITVAVTRYSLSLQPATLLQLITQMYTHVSLM